LSIFYNYLNFLKFIHDTARITTRFWMSKPRIPNLDGLIINFNGTHKWTNKYYRLIFFRRYKLQVNLRTVDIAIPRKSKTQLINWSYLGISFKYFKLLSIDKLTHGLYIGNAMTIIVITRHIWRIPRHSGYEPLQQI